ncbi:MAG: hypothetical protein AAGA12_08000 [Pseudomonadota bacterium]
MWNKLKGQTGRANPQRQVPQPEARRKPVPRLLNLAPRPLILPNEKMVISWSPKCACTHVLMWYLAQAKLLGDARRYDAWPHMYRQHVLQKSDAYRAARRGVYRTNGEGFTLLKVTRSPVARMTSIFRHAIRSKPIKRAIAQGLGYDVEASGVSLRDLDRFMTGRDLLPPSEIDQHLCAQTQPMWNMPFSRVITLNIDTDNLDENLERIEAVFGLDPVQIDEHSELKTMAEYHYAKPPEGQLDGAIEEFRFTKATRHLFSKAAFQAHPEIARMAHEHHPWDFNGTNSSDTEGEIFSVP